MTILSHRWLALLGTALPLLLALAAPGDVRAECGDYLRIAVHDPSSPIPTVPDRPCDGPSCSRRNLPMVPSAPVSTPTLDNEWCWTSSFSLDMPPAVAGWLAISICDIPVGAGLPIYHPPR